MKTNSLARHIVTTLLIFLVNFACNYAAPVSQITEIHTTFDEKTLDNPKMIWGETTNFLTGENHFTGIVRDGQPLKPVLTAIRGGIWVSNGLIILSGRPLKVLHMSYKGFENVSTNTIDAFLPTFNERFAVTMFDTNGILVPKSRAGLSLGQSPSLKFNTAWHHWKRYSYMSAHLWPKSILMYELDPTKYFVIKKPGLYKLTVIQNLYVVNTNGYLERITLPPVTTDVMVED